MATVLQPIVNELNTVLVQLRTELRGLQTDADGVGIAIYPSTRPGHIHPGYPANPEPRLSPQKSHEKGV